MAFHVTAAYIQQEREREADEARLARLVTAGRLGPAGRARLELGNGLIALGRLVAGDAAARRQQTPFGAG
jgi:hypothetical protein